MGRYAVACLLAGAVLASPAPAATEVVRSGSLSAVVESDPWRIELVGEDGAEVLGQPDPTAAGTEGNLGFRTGTGSARAVRASALERAGDAVRATVETTDPLGRTLQVNVSPAGEGSIRIESVVGDATGVTASSVGFDAAIGERFTGFGERSTAVDQRGRDVENYVADGPYPERARTIIFLPGLPWAVRQRDDATYYPVPWTLSSRGYGVLVENDETSTFHMGSASEDFWSAEVEAARLSVRVFSGPRPADALRRFTAATGRQPKPQAPWAFGPWFQTGQPNVIPIEDEQAWVSALREGDAPVSVAETQMHYLPCGAHREDPAYERARTEHFHGQGLARLSYFNPLICTDYEPVYSQAVGVGALQMRPDSDEPYTYPAYVGGAEPVGFTIKPLAQFDFTAPAGRELYDSLLAEGVGDGLDGWMEDFGEYTPPDSRSADGTAGTQMHNRYPTTYHCSVRDFQDARLEADPKARPLVRFSRSGWTGTAACADNVWGGDPTTVFGYDGLSSAVMQGLSIGTSGIARWGSDIGGYHTFGPDQELTLELLARWIEFGSVSGVMRTKASGFEVPPYERPQIWEPETIGIWRQYAKLHTQLNPYLQAAEAEYRRTGMPIMRHHVLTHPRDIEATALEDQFMFGPGLLAAPVIEEGATTRKVYAPRPGRWLDFWRSVRYRKNDGGYYARAAKPVPTGERTEVDAPLDRLPMLIRSGAMLPMLPPDVDTLADYGDKPGLVHLSDRLDEMRILAFPRGRSRAGMNETERLVSRERGGEQWTLRIDGERAREYEVEAALGALRKPFAPESVEVDGEELPAGAWSYRPRGRLLRADVECEDCKLIARP